MSMLKYKDAFKDNPNPQNAKRFLDWLNKHPMSEVLMNNDDISLKVKAWEIVTGEKG